MTYPEAELLDLSGPSGVFNTANQLLETTAYRIMAASPKGGLVKHSCGLELDTLPLRRMRFGGLDTVLVIGAYTEALKRAVGMRGLHTAMSAASQRAERFGSICTGAFILGSAGLLDGRRAATHWSAQGELETRLPTARLDRHSLYCVDGRLWTSAGVTSGIDMALAMLERDHGPVLKAQVARQIVVYLHRPGGQTQFSRLLDLQTELDNHFLGLFDWIHAHIDRRIAVSEMAAVVAMSERSFHRCFRQHFAKSPGKFLEEMRMEHARALIESGSAVAHAAARVGFRSPSAFRKAFKSYVGVPPSHYANMNQIAEGRTPMKRRNVRRKVWVEP
ncbi:MAG: helix-turn-helix domain-containing protein [Myxococcota bacterium]